MTILTLAKSIAGTARGIGPVGFVPFVSNWNTENLSPGSSTATQLKIPTVSSGAYNCVVNWGDGTTNKITTWNDAAWMHTYGASGVKQVRIQGQFEGLRFNNTGDKLKLLSVGSFGPEFRLKNAGSYFYDCTNSAEIGSDLITTAITNFFAAWHSNTSLTSFPLLDVSSGTNFSYAWYNNASLTSFPLLDVSSGTNFEYAWLNNTSLTSFPLLNVSSGTNFYTAWLNNTSLTSFAVGQGSKMGAMTNGDRMLLGTTFTTEAYSRLLEEIAAVNFNTGVPFHGGNAKYNATNGKTARDILVGRGWTITDGGPT